MLLLILISSVLEIKAFQQSICRDSGDCASLGQGFECNQLYGICQNSWDFSRPCLEDYECPRGYACEAFCKTYSKRQKLGESERYRPPWMIPTTASPDCFSRTDTKYNLKI